MNPLLWTLFFLLLIGLGVNFLVEDNGYVLIQFLDYSLETSLPIFGLILVAAYLLVRLIALVWSSPGILRQRLAAKKIKKSNQRILDGLELIGRGEFYKAEKKIKSAVNDSNNSVLPYLIAAEVSQKDGNSENCIDWLKKAKKKYPALETYINLNAAKLMIESKNYEVAQQSINAALNQEPNNPVALKLLAEVYYETSDWQLLTQKARTILDATGNDPKLERYFSEAFNHQAKVLSGNAEELKYFWNRLPSRIENKASILAARLESIMSFGQHESVEKELRRAIPKTWNRQLIALYAKLDTPDLATLSKRIEHWLVDRPRDSNLWLAASQLAKRDELWTQAKQFLERCLENKETALAYNELGLILLELGHENEAIKAFNKALNLNKNQ
jgi:HemY protein